MAPSKAAQVFGVTELCEGILAQLDGDGAVLSLFALQRVSSKFKDVITGSIRLQTMMGLRFERDQEDNGCSKGLTALHQSINFQPLLVMFGSALDSCSTTVHRQLPTETAASAQQWQCVASLPEVKERIGLYGAKALHTRKEASLRHINLLNGPHPLTVTMEVNPSTENNLCARSSKQVSTERRFFLLRWYKEEIRLAPGLATPGNLADQVEKILSRSEDEHRIFSQGRVSLRCHKKVKAWRLKSYETASSPPHLQSSADKEM